MGFNCREPGKTGDDVSLPRSISLAARSNRSTTRRGVGSNASFFGISVLVRRDTSAVFSGYRDSCFDFNFRTSPFTWEPECRESKYLKGTFFSGKKTTWDSICCPWDRKQNLWNTFSSTKAHWFNLRSGPILEDFGHSPLFAFPAGIIVTKQNEYILSLFSS